MRRAYDSLVVMFTIVVLFLKANKNKLEKYPRTWAAVITLEDEVRQIHEAAKLQATIANGVTAAKHKIREALVLFCNRVRLAVIVAADDAGEEKLKVQLEMSLSDLRAQRDAELLRFSQIVRDEAVLHADVIADAGVDDEVLAAYSIQIDEYESSLTNQNESMNGRASSTSDLGKLTKQANKHVRKKLDLLMEAFRTADPAFFEEYKRRRAVKELGVRHEQTPPEPPAETPSASNDVPGENSSKGVDPHADDHKTDTQT
jgi:hypothetical protein